MTPSDYYSDEELDDPTSVPKKTQRWSYHPKTGLDVWDDPSRVHIHWMAEHGFTNEGQFAGGMIDHFPDGRVKIIDYHSTDQPMQDEARGVLQAQYPGAEYKAWPLDVTQKMYYSMPEAERAQVQPTVTDRTRDQKPWFKRLLGSDWGEKTAMPARPSVMDSYLQELAPNEQFEVPHEGGHCVNPKCRMQFDDSMLDMSGDITCPNCGTQNNVWSIYDQPGGTTRAGLTPTAMGQIGEKVIEEMHEIPGVGTIAWMHDTYTSPIDCIVESQRGKFGCEIKTNHAQSQEQFKLGDRAERTGKIKYCLENGLKPALIGVRLNFYTDLAYVFFREGMSDTWYSNQKMMHVATINFAHLNPFKSPDPAARHTEIENAHLPDSDDTPFDSWEDMIENQHMIPDREASVTAANDPDYLFVYYKSELRVKKWEHNLHQADMLDELLDEYGMDMSNQGLDIDPAEVAAGEIFTYPDGERRIEHKQLSNPDVREHAEELIDDWLTGWRGLDQVRDPDTGQFV